MKPAQCCANAHTEIVPGADKVLQEGADRVEITVVSNRQLRYCTECLLQYVVPHLTSILTRHPCLMMFPCVVAPGHAAAFTYVIPVASPQSSIPHAAIQVCEADAWTARMVAIL